MPVPPNVPLLGIFLQGRGFQRGSIQPEYRPGSLHAWLEERPMYVNFSSLSRTLLLTGLVAGMALAATSSQAQNDPPPGSARLAYIQGDVSVQPNNVDNWGQAENNMPLGPGDRIYTDRGLGQLQIGQIEERRRLRVTELRSDVHHADSAARV